MARQRFTDYIFYNSTTGEILQCRKMKSHAKAEQNCGTNPNMSCMQGFVTDVNKWKVNVSDQTLVPISDKTPTPNMQLQCRQKRNSLLQVCDWTQAADSPLSDTKKAEWATYRQALRDMPDHLGNCHCYADINWPTPPA